MHRIAVTVLMFALVAAGCQHPTEVVVHDTGADDQLDIATVAVVDTATYQPRVDSAAISPEDQARFSSFLLVTRTTYDDGAVVASSTSSEALFTDPQRPLQVGGKVFGMWGIALRPTSLGAITLNGQWMVPAVYRLRVGGLAVPFGTHYVRDLMTSARLDTTFTWRASPDSMGAIDASIDGPPGISCQQPRGGAVLSRKDDMVLAWKTGVGVKIYLSLWDPSTRRSKPLLAFTPRGMHGRATIPAKVLALLPKDRTFVLSFTSTRRVENLTIARYPGAVLVQAASVYNVIFELR